MVANDPGLFELAEALADRVLSEKETTEDRVQQMFRHALCRYPTQEEMDFLVGFLQTQNRKFMKTENGTESDALRYAWIAVARVLMNLDEFITRE